jgi:hypothetical protein
MTEATKRRCRVIGAAWLAVLLAGCGGGGSGSTGLITSEVEVIDDVRSGGTCEEFDGTPYCGTDSPNAVAPGGESVSVVGTAVPTPARTGTPAVGPTPAAATPTHGGAGPTPSPQRTAGQASGTPPPTSPKPTSLPGDQTTVRLQVEGFDDGAACATAARSAESEDPWTTAALVPLDPEASVTVFPLPTSVTSPRDAALLCFDDPPAELAPELETLTDAAPTVVFVLP